MSGSSRARRAAPWVSVALLGTFAGLLFGFALSTFGAPSEPSVRIDRHPAVAQAAARDHAGSSVGGLVAAVPTSVPVPVASQPPSSDAQAVAGPPPAASGSSATSSGLRLSIPTVAIDAPVIDLGVNAEGQLDVPQDSTSVGWYDISSRPGEPGNALIGGHLDWAGSLAVFWRLGELQPGDRIELNSQDGSQLVYEVRSTGSVDWDQPLSDILARGEGESSLTLFTCGGSFDRSRGEYVARQVVWATLVEPASLASRR